jgi:osmotically-inducible protein OsmY
MKNDAQLRRDVINELVLEPLIIATHIGVTVKDGVVTLFGHVNSFFQRAVVGWTVKRVPGVQGLAMKIGVRLPDQEAWREAATAYCEQQGKAVVEQEHTLLWKKAIPVGRVQVNRDAQGYLTLAGEVDWGFQRLADDEAVRHLLDSIGIKSEKVLQNDVKTERRMDIREIRLAADDEEWNSQKIRQTLEETPAARSQMERNAIHYALYVLWSDS